MEIQFLQWVDATFHSQAWLNYIMKYITYIGEFGAGAIICALVLLIFKKTRWAGVAVGCALVLDVLIVNVILKLSVNRARPWSEYEPFLDFYKAYGVRQPTDSSFPSGHSAALFAAAVALTFRYKLKALPAIIIALLVALSRIYLCLHYPTDVLGGIAIGSACGVAGHFAATGLKKLYEEKLAPLIQKRRGITPEQPTEEANEPQPEQQTEQTGEPDQQ